MTVKFLANQAGRPIEQSALKQITKLPKKQVVFTGEKKKLKYSYTHYP